MENETLIEAAIRVLKTSDPNEKARLGDSISVKWLEGEIGVSECDAEAGKSRQAIVHSLVHTESWAIDLSWARGLDVLPMTISRFSNGGDKETADLLETVVYPEEITHCAAGVKWFKYLCERSKHPEFTINSKESDDSNEEIINKFHSEGR